ncbi:MAG: rhomboid family intramembrane serine protease [Armatimonadota bacterium]|jgi:membrane associated rhomboid family serine protease
MLFPYSTERQLQRTPWATLAIIGVNVVVAAMTLFSEERTLLLAFAPEAFYWWQPLTAMFTHGGVEHLIGNMILLWVFGAHVEDTIGIPRFLLLYFSAGFAAEALQIGADLVVLRGLRGGLGASGCIMGLVALFATRYRHVKVNIFYLFPLYFRGGTWQVSAVYVAGFYVVLDVLLGALGFFGFQDGVAHFAHLGGFGCGVAWSYGLHLPAEVARDEVREDAATFAAAGAFKSAGAAVESALQERPRDADLHRQAASYFGARDETQQRAIAHWGQAIRLWLAQGEQERGLEEWGRLRRRHGTDVLGPAVLCRVGVALEDAGSQPEAIEAYAAAARQDYDDQSAPVAAMRLGKLLEAAGHGEQARGWYEYVVRTWPDTMEALDAADRLDLPHDGAAAHSAAPKNAH